MAGSASSASPLVIFHMNMNYASLREDYIRAWLKQLANMGYNAILWELEDKVQWETCPECVWPEALSKETFRSILAYSRELGLEPIPLLQTAGHAESVLIHEKYFPFRESADHIDCYCTSNPEVRRLLKNWIVEYAELFGDLRYFHLGGDEAYQFGTCPRCAAIVQKTSKNQLYVEHMQEIAAPLFERGIKPGFWCDMILHYPEEVAAIPRDFAIWDWNYWDNDQPPETVRIWGKGHFRREEIEAATLEAMPEIMDEDGKLRAFYTTDVLQRLGFDVFLCSASRSGGDSVFCGQHEVHAGNVIGAARKAVNRGILGTCVTSWAVRTHNLETQAPWLYLAPLTVRHPSRSYAELLGRCSEDLFGAPGTDFFQAIEQIGQPFLFGTSVTTGLIWFGQYPQAVPSGALEEKLMPLFAGNRDANWRGRTGKEHQEQLARAKAGILAGFTALQEFIPRAKKGLSVLHAWSKAGYHQLCRAHLAEKIMAFAEDDSQINSEDILAVLRETRGEYLQWAGQWLTPRSAELHTALIFDLFSDFVASRRALVNA